MMLNAKWLAALAAATLALMALDGGRVEADNIVAATESGSSSTFGTLDLTTGVFTPISNLSIEVVGLTESPGGTIYATDNTNGSLYTIAGGVATPFGTASVPGAFGLAYVYAGGFYAPNINVLPTTLVHISPDGNSTSTVGGLGSEFTAFGSGGLAFGPDALLYFVASNASGTTALFSVNTATGAATQIGSGLGIVNQDVLTLVTIGGLLYGIDTVEPSGSGPINIYTINTTTGVATATGVTVTGLTAGYTLDTAAAPAVVPEPSALALGGIAVVIGLAVARYRRRRA